MKTVKGFQYCVTANEEVTITDDNGLNLTCPAGQQTYFVATGDEVEVAGDAVITQTRGGIIAGGGGGGGEKIAPGEVVVGGTQGSAFIAHLNECTRCPMFIDEELPEGVTFEKLESGFVANVKDTATTTQLSYVFPSSAPHSYGSIFARTTITQLPSSINFASLINGSYMFYYCSSLTSFEGDLPALTNGSNMFRECSSLTSFEGDLPALTNGTAMFFNCSSLTSFDVALPALTTGSSMFYGCKSLTSFDVALPALTTGDQMFHYCSNLTSFESDMPALTNGSNMFSSCTSLTSFSGDMPALTNGESMFSFDSALTSFESDLPALTNGNGMFNSSKLDIPSVNRIVTTVPSYTSGSHRITIGVDSTQVTQAQQDAANAIIVDKGWTVTWKRY